MGVAGVRERLREKRAEERREETLSGWMAPAREPAKRDPVAIPDLPPEPWAVSEAREALQGKPVRLEPQPESEPKPYLWPVRRGARDQLKPAGEGFGALLRGFRVRLDMSQGDLGARTGFQHSYISRLELGTRHPSKDAVESLAAALHLNDEDRALLLHAEGYGFGDEPVTDPRLLRLHAMLGDADLSDEIKADIGHLLRVALMLGEQEQRTS